MLDGTRCAHLDVGVATEHGQNGNAVCVQEVTSNASPGLNQKGCGCVRPKLVVFYETMPFGDVAAVLEYLFDEQFRQGTAGFWDAEPALAALFEAARTMLPVMNVNLLP